MTQTIPKWFAEFFEDIGDAPDGCQVDMQFDYGDMRQLKEYVSNLKAKNTQLKTKLAEKTAWGDKKYYEVEEQRREVADLLEEWRELTGRECRAKGAGRGAKQMTRPIEPKYSHDMGWHCMACGARGPAPGEIVGSDWQYAPMKELIKVIINYVLRDLMEEE